MKFIITKRIDLVFDKMALFDAKWEALNRCKGEISQKEYFLLGTYNEEKIMEIYMKRKELGKKFPFIETFAKAFEESISYDFTKASNLATYEATKLEETKN